MSLYVDSSALLKRYIDEPDSDVAESFLLEDPEWVTARHTEIEVRRNLARLLQGESLVTAREQLQVDLENMDLVELDATTCSLAATAAEISAIKLAAPAVLERAVDAAIQIHGGAGLSDDTPLAALLGIAKALRIADGPDEVHRVVIARAEVARYLPSDRPK